MRNGAPSLQEKIEINEKIKSALADQPYTVERLSDTINVPRDVVEEHVKKLERKGVVEVYGMGGTVASYTLKKTI